MMTNEIQIVKRRLIGNWLIGLRLYRDTAVYESRLCICWTFNRVQPGSNIWQMYAKR